MERNETQPGFASVFTQRERPHLVVSPFHPCSAAFSRPRAPPLVPGMHTDLLVDRASLDKTIALKNTQIRMLLFPPKISVNFVARRSMASAASKSAAPLTFDRYPFLRELGLAPENAGVFNGTWGGSGDWFTSVNPATNEPIARVRGGTVAECVSCALPACVFTSRFSSSCLHYRYNA